MDEKTYGRTRHALHAVAELLIAGPQYRQFGTIRLRAVHGGFGGVKSGVSVVGGELVWAEGRTALQGTYRDVAKIAGLDAGAPEGLYQDTTGVSLDETIEVDPTIAAEIGAWFELGDKTLRCLAPDITPVLWPEHFDLSIAVGEVNYGASPGDDGHPGPYAYVGPWTPRTGPFWNASFGALRPREDVNSTSSLLEFFEQGRAAAVE
ncbi:hypothetical protein [Nocardia sp. NPDC049149]|uniref:hypothetical protein n=1 Tax=Nocardia sp. NPDC049149 TaxID=3364315 RepID=UPI003710AC3E